MESRLSESRIHQISHPCGPASSPTYYFFIEVSESPCRSHRIRPCLRRFPSSSSSLRTPEQTDFLASLEQFHGKLSGGSKKGNHNFDPA